MSMYLDYAENQAARQIPMKMADWVAKLDAFLQFNEYEVLANAGKVSAEVASGRRGAVRQVPRAPGSRVRERLRGRGEAYRVEAPPQEEGGAVMRTPRHPRPRSRRSSSTTFSARLRRHLARWLRPRARHLPVRGPRIHQRHAAQGSGRSSKRCTGRRRASRSYRPLQVDGRERLARDAAPRLQVLRAHALRRLFQGRARAEPGARGALRQEPPRPDPPARFRRARRSRSMSRSA